MAHCPGRIHRGANYQTGKPTTLRYIQWNISASHLCEGRHCEERSEEAIQCGASALDCFASLAMTRMAQVGAPRAVARGPLIVIPRSGSELEAVEVHHLVPRRHEVLHELLLAVGTSIDLSERA